MKKIKSLCLIAALGAMVTGGSLLQSAPAYAAAGQTITVSAKGSDLATAISRAKAGDTIVISGTVKSDSVEVPAGVNIKGDSKTSVIDFTPSFSGKKKAGLTLKGNGSTISGLEIDNAYDNGIYVTGSSNKLTDLNVHNNNDAGVQLSNGASNNTLTRIKSHDNCDQYGKADPKKRGENADGFAIKLGSGEGNKLYSCDAYGNGDDGYDLYAAHGAVYFENCTATKNGAFNTGKEIIKGDGNGFKLGGIDNKTDPSHPTPVPEEHQCVNCTATDNLAAGFDRNNQTGTVTMTGCTAQNNKLGNYSWPLKIHPSAMGKKEIVCNPAKIVSCKSLGSTNAEDDLSGADLSGKCTGFVNKAHSGN